MSGDESIRLRLQPEPEPDGSPPARIVEISREETMDLLADTPWGRVIFSEQALPAVRLVNHVIDDGHIVIRTHTGAAILGPAEEEAVVAYEADRLDGEERGGWWATVTGVASLIRDPDERRRLEALLEPWAGGRMEHVVRISPDIVTGYRLTREP